MAYVSDDFRNLIDAPKGQWCSSPNSKLGPYEKLPPVRDRNSPDYAGECVSFPKRACRTLGPTIGWKKGRPVAGDTTILPGTAIATFLGKNGGYKGHAAIYHEQHPEIGVLVWDQWVSDGGKPIGPRTLKWTNEGYANHPKYFYVIE